VVIAGAVVAVGAVVVACVVVVAVVVVEEVGVTVVVAVASVVPGAGEPIDAGGVVGTGDVAGLGVVAPGATAVSGGGAGSSAAARTGTPSTKLATASHTPATTALRDPDIKHRYHATGRLPRCTNHRATLGNRQAVPTLARPAPRALKYEAAAGDLQALASRWHS
jgi:hypothetical protein